MIQVAIRGSAIGLLLMAGAVLSACASFSPDGGMTVVAATTEQTIGKDIAFLRSADDAARIRGTIRRLLSRPLTADAAVQVTLLSNKGLQAAYNELALAETDLVEQSLPPNPVFSISRISGNGASEVERQVVGDILALATLPFRSDISRERFRQAQLRAALETLRTSPPMSGAPTSAAWPPTRWSACLPMQNRPRNQPRNLREDSARPARSTSSIRRASRYFTRRPRQTLPLHGRRREATANGFLA